MYHAKKFSTVSLVPHKTQGSEPVASAGGMGSSSMKSSTPPGGGGKQRLRWTEDLHNRFVDAIAQLGGPDSSKDEKKGSLDGLTNADSSQGLQINEALKMQMEVQKRLHEQLE
ncbi:Myb family transcription factor PHL7, partial [Bienertia sinuspersici]